MVDFGSDSEAWDRDRRMGSQRVDGGVDAIDRRNHPGDEIGRESSLPHLLYLFKIFINLFIQVCGHSTQLMV